MPPLLDRLPEKICWFKIGLELFAAEGPAALQPLKDRNKKIFLDLKLHDIPRTVERAVQAVEQHGVDMLTIHATGGRAMLEAAAQAAHAMEHPPLLIAVTTLTSLNEQDFNDLGIQRNLQTQARALGQLAMEAGIDGLVTSVHEAKALREQFGSEAALVTPGIRMPADAAGDQKRVATPADAVQAGSNFLVVGRTIVQAPDPGKAAEDVLSNMQNMS
jgi:orotidine-5'-phosphate decarboxylase